MQKVFFFKKIFLFTWLKALLCSTYLMPSEFQTIIQTLTFIKNYDKIPKIIKIYEFMISENPGTGE